MAAMAYTSYEEIALGFILGGSGCTVKEKHPAKVCLQDDSVKRRLNKKEGLPRVPKENTSLVVLFH
jgi:hypothetical protein